MCGQELWVYVCRNKRSINSINSTRCPSGVLLKLLFSTDLQEVQYKHVCIVCIQINDPEWNTESPVSPAELNLSGHKWLCGSEVRRSFIRYR